MTINDSSSTPAPGGNCQLMSDADVIQRIFDHIDSKTTDMGKSSWKEPVNHYLCEQRLDAERKLMRRRTTVFCPSSALTKPGDYICRDVAGVPLIVLRGLDHKVRGFINACRHRGVQLAEGNGCTRALVCPYHGWAYSLDGQLKNIPHAEGFPDVDKKTRGLVEVACTESKGLVFINQTGFTQINDEIETLPSLISDTHRLLRSESQIINANWKLYIESSLEGYHIRETHKGTFYPIQYDNLTVVETFAENNRIAFPYQSIEGLRQKPPAQWSVNGRLTYVYHLFPNVVISTFPDCLQIVVLEPIDTSTTRQHSYLISHVAEDDKNALANIHQGQEFARNGAIEDQNMVSSAQRGLESGANEHLEFGLFESAIGHFHCELEKELAIGVKPCNT